MPSKMWHQTALRQAYIDLLLRTGRTDGAVVVALSKYQFDAEYQRQLDEYRATWPDAIAFARQDDTADEVWLGDGTLVGICTVPDCACERTWIIHGPEVD